MRKSIRCLVWVARLVLSILFIFSGLMKGIDPMGTAIKIEEYFATASLPMTSWLAMTGAVALCLFEFTLGVALLVGVWRRSSGALATIMMTAMTLLTLYIMVNDPISDCGCFGDAVKLSNEATFVKNLLLLPLAFVLLHYSEYVSPLLSFRRGKLAVAGFALVMANFLFVTVMDLPAVDFRPFKVGTDLLKAKSAQKAETDDPEDFRFVYRKDGEERIVKMDELDRIDSTWVFVRDASREPVAVVQGTAADFSLTDEYGSDVSSLLMTAQRRIFVYCSGPKGSDKILADRERLERLAKIAHDHGGSLYIATAYALPSDPGDPIWSLRDTAPLYHMDATTMKTVVRSDPALLIISDGVLVRKVADRKIDDLLEDEDFIAKAFDAESQLSAVKRGNTMRFIPFVVALLVLGVLIFFNKKNVLTYKPR